MNRKLLTVLGSGLLVISFILGACAQPTPAPAPEQPAAPQQPAATEAPMATEAPAVTEVPPEETPPSKVPIAVYDGKSLSVPDCDYGGYIKSIEATDDHTVTFTLCKPDPAFEVKLGLVSSQFTPRSGLKPQPVRRPAPVRAWKDRWVLVPIRFKSGSAVRAWFWSRTRITGIRN